MIFPMCCQNVNKLKDEIGKKMKERIRMGAMISAKATVSTMAI